MADETITRQVSERYASALATGEQMCCPTTGEALACGLRGRCC
ncbi:MAG: hypothetical protein ACT4QB_18430 [Gammaproteobacteria bacterium]